MRSGRTRCNLRSLTSGGNARVIGSDVSVMLVTLSGDGDETLWAAGALIEHQQHTTASIHDRAK